jgi:hypothetical protein
LQRRTQTNETRRCATLLPALNLIRGPLALIEVGASAGLCINLDLYSYDYGSTALAGTHGAPVLRCEVRGSLPAPPERPDVVWRAGLDLNPLDATNPDDALWLECLVWPGQDERLSNLRKALDVARAHPVSVEPGDLLIDLPRLVAQAPEGATVVVLHSAVLAYVDDVGREQFAATISELGVRWLANEAPGVVPGVVAPRASEAQFILSLDGHALAFTQPHGEWIEWIG